MPVAWRGLLFTQNSDHCHHKLTLSLKCGCFDLNMYRISSLIIVSMDSFLRSGGPDITGACFFLFSF